MKLVKKIYIALGRAAYVLVIPITWIWFARRIRAYVLIEQDAQVLLVNNWLGNGEWSLPGGGSHYRESSLQAALREVKEELKLDLVPSKVRFLKEGYHKRPVGGKHYALFHYMLPASATIKPHKLELAETTWVPLLAVKSTPGVNHEVLAAIDART